MTENGDPRVRAFVHRVRNDFQVALALLALEVGDGVTDAAYASTQRRLLALALGYAHLGADALGQRVEVLPFFKDFFHASFAGRVALSHRETIELPLSTASRLALLLGEHLADAIGRMGSATISLTCTDELLEVEAEIEPMSQREPVRFVADDDERHALLHALAEQLGATVNRGPGGSIVVKLPASATGPGD